VNLAVKLLLFNGNVGDLSKEMKQIVTDVQEDVSGLREARLKAWRARRVVKKLYNIIVYIIRRNDFLSQIEIDMKKLPAMMVHLDNDTRWSSTYDMIQSAIRNFLIILLRLPN
jgi:hypothetical protein